MPLENLEEEGLEKIPDLRLAQWVFRGGLSKTTSADKEELQAKIMKVIREESEFQKSVAPNELATWWGVLSAAVNVAGGLGPWLTMSIMSTAVVWLGSDAWRSTFIIIGMCCLFCGNIFAFHLFGFQLPRLRNQSLHKNVADNIRLPSDGPRHGVATEEDTRVHHRTVAQTSQVNELPVDNTSESLGKDVVTDVYHRDKQHQSDNILLRFQTLCNTLSPTYQLLLCASAALHMSSTFLRFAICNWFPVMLRQYQELYSIQITNLFVSVFELGGILGNLLAGLLSDLGVTHKPSCFLNPRIPYILGHMAIACVVLCGLGLSIAAGIPWGILMMSALLLGLSVFGAVSLCGVLAVELVPVSLSGTSHALTALCANGLSGYRRTGDMNDKYDRLHAFASTSLHIGEQHNFKRLHPHSDHSHLLNCIFFTGGTFD
ncbi:protein transport protein SEC13, partial [Clonorchis sinensis]